MEEIADPGVVTVAVNHLLLEVGLCSASVHSRYPTTGCRTHPGPPGFMQILVIMTWLIFKFNLIHDLVTSTYFQPAVWRY